MSRYRFLKFAFVIAAAFSIQSAPLLRYNFPVYAQSSAEINARKAELTKIRDNALEAYSKASTKAALSAIELQKTQTKVETLKKIKHQLDLSSEMFDECKNKYFTGPTTESSLKGYDAKFAESIKALDQYISQTYNTDLNKMISENANLSAIMSASQNASYNSGELFSNISDQFVKTSNSYSTAQKCFTRVKSTLTSVNYECSRTVTGHSLCKLSRTIQDLSSEYNLGLNKYIQRSLELVSNRELLLFQKRLLLTNAINEKYASEVVAEINSISGQARKQTDVDRLVSLAKISNEKLSEKAEKLAKYGAMFELKNTILDLKLNLRDLELVMPTVTDSQRILIQTQIDWVRGKIWGLEERHLKESLPNFQRRAIQGLSKLVSYFPKAIANGKTTESKHREIKYQIDSFRIRLQNIEKSEMTSQKTELASRVLFENDILAYTVDLEEMLKGYFQ